jgi:hypothetical protein
MSEAALPVRVSAELPGVVCAEYVALPDGATRIDYSVDVPASAPREYIVPAGEVAVVRFIGAAGANERVEVAGMDDVAARGNGVLPEVCFSVTGRQGELCILDPAYAHHLALYMGGELQRLRRLDQFEAMPRMSDAARHVRRRRGAHHGWQQHLNPHGTRLLMAERQRTVVDRLMALATRDYLEGEFHPETARERAQIQLKDAS